MNGSPGSPATLASIEDVYRRRYARFLRVARALLGDEESARDAVQEAFARAIRGRFGYRGEGSLEAWLWRTFLNTCADHSRGASVRSAVPRDRAENGYAEDWPELRAAVAALPERQRQALFLRHYADLDYESIAEALGVERGTVAATLHTAHGALRRAISEVQQ